MINRLLALIIFFFISHFSLCGLESQTYYIDNQYQTFGKVSFPLSIEDLTTIVTDYENYRLWSLKGLDGNDPTSEDFIGLLKDVIWDKDENIYHVIYDINLFWPFGSKGNKIDFYVTEDRNINRTIWSISFTLKDSSMIVDNAFLILHFYIQGKESTIYFRCNVKFTWFINIFFSLKFFKSNIEWRILRIIENLEKYIKNYLVNKK